MAKPRKPKNEESKPDNSGALVRHQKLCLSIDMDKQLIYGYTELEIAVPDIGIVGLHAENLGIESVFVDGEPTEFEYYPHVHHHQNSAENDKRWSSVSSPSSAADFASSAYILALERELVPNLLINCCKVLLKADCEQQEPPVVDNGLQLQSSEPKQNVKLVRINYWVEKAETGIHFEDNVLLTDNQIRRARCWFPCMDDSSQRCCYDLEFTVANNLVAVSTGSLLYQTGPVSGKSGNQMDWNANNAYKTFKDMEPKAIMDITVIPNIDPIDIGLGSSEKANTVPSSKPRKKTMTSVFLKFFETAPDGKSRRCKFCGQSYSIATATGNLGRHLSNRHPGYDKSADAVTTSAPQPVVVIKKSQSQGKAIQVDYDHLNWLLIKWLILASLPPSTLEEKWLANSFRFLNPSVQLWPGEKYKAVFREVFRSMREDVRISLEQVSSKVSITLDFWSSYEEIYYMSVSCQWIDGNWSFQKVLLDICHIPHPCGGAEIYHALVKVLKMYNIENKVLSCTHNNSPNAMHACHTLKEDLDGQKVGPFCYIPCAARTLNLIIDDGLKSTKPLISKVREFILELNTSMEISEAFIQYTTAYQEGSWKFPLDASARWSGNYQILDIVRKAGKSMDTVIRKYENSLDSRMLLSSTEKSAISLVHSFLEPLYKTTNNICANKVPTIGLVLFFMDHISETIANCRDSHHHPDWLKNTAEDMAKKVRSYNSQVFNIFTYMTAILDPRIKSELIPESLNSENYLEEARTHFMRNYSANHFPSMTSAYGAQDIDDGGSVSFAEEIARKKRRASMSTATDELTQYLSEPPAPIPTDVLDWWKVNSTRYPRLSLMARDFLTVQATSVAPEELFCSKGDEIHRQRFCMPHDSTQALLCIRSWSQGGIKLKYKSTEIDYERLMELAAAATAENSFAGMDKKQKMTNLV